MIAKRIEFRNVNLSSFSKLIQYITNAQGKNERVGAIRVSHCQSEHPEWAAIEAEAVQAKNTRTGMDKTYHLLVSFREGDYPAAEVLQTIEERMCATLGYGEHQRVSAVHYDTDHMHIHIAINKIHPTRFTAHEPYFDKRKLGVLCATLENEYGIVPDNHIPKMTPGEAKAQDMEKAAGIESLIGWMKRGCLSELLISGTWQELHTVLARNGLQLTQRGNGLSIVDRTNGIAAKASSVHRGLSKNVLEKRLGPFQPCAMHAVAVTAGYSPKPMASKMDTGPLWTQYQQERLQHKQRHAVLRERAKQRKDRRIEQVKKTASAKRAAITLTQGGVAKMLLYRSISEGLLSEIKAIQRDYREDTQQMYAKGKHRVWYDWLKAKAWEGNTQALDVLRHRYERGALPVNAITGEAIDRVNYRAGAPIEAVTKRGTIHYQIAQTVLRDDGKRLRMAEHVSPEAIAAALRIATQRFGPKLTISGTEYFRRQVVEVSVGTKLHVIFTDPEMRAQRQELMALKSGTGISADDAAARYIAERTATRKKGVDLLPHRCYAEGDAGTLAYAGVRQIEGNSLMLLQTPSEMLVLPIDDATANRIQHLHIGDRVDVNALGQVRTHARRM